MFVLRAASRVLIRLMQRWWVENDSPTTSQKESDYVSPRIWSDDDWAFYSNQDPNLRWSPDSGYYREAVQADADSDPEAEILAALDRWESEIGPLLDRYHWLTATEAVAAREALDACERFAATPGISDQAREDVGNLMGHLGCIATGWSPFEDAPQSVYDDRSFATDAARVLKRQLEREAARRKASGK